MEDVKANMLQGIMHSTRKVKAMTTTKRVTRMRPRGLPTRDQPKKSSRDKERRKNSRKYQPRKWSGDLWAIIIYSWFGEYSLQRSKSTKKAGNTEERRKLAATENENHDRHDREDQGKRQNGCKQLLVDQ